MVSDIQKRIAYANKKAQEREEQAEIIKNQIVSWPEYSNYSDIYVYVGSGVKCGYLLILNTEDDLVAFKGSLEKTEFERKFLSLAASELSSEVSDLKAMIEYDSQENLNKNYGGSIARRLAD